MSVRIYAFLLAGIGIGLGGLAGLDSWSIDDLSRVQIWYTPTVLGVSIPFLLFKACQEGRFRAVDLDPNEDRQVSFHELLIFCYKNLGVWLNCGTCCCMISQVWKSIVSFTFLSNRVFCLRVNLDNGARHWAAIVLVKSALPLTLCVLRGYWYPHGSVLPSPSETHYKFRRLRDAALRSSLVAGLRVSQALSHKRVFSCHIHFPTGLSLVFHLRHFARQRSIKVGRRGYFAVVES